MLIRISVTVLKTGLTPSASGSAYLELEPSPLTTGRESQRLTDTHTGLKLSCTVHGPRPLPRSVPYSPHLLLSTHVKFAPFAARQRRGYIRDASERDLSIHLESALRGVIIGERWPKSGLEIIIAVLEGEEDYCSGETSRSGAWAMMSILSGCITVASAAIADAGVDCVDLITGGVAAIVHQPFSKRTETQQIHGGRSTKIVLDPCPSEHQEIGTLCLVAYLHSRDEITEVWSKGDSLNLTISQKSDQNALDVLMDHAVEAAIAARLVLIESLSESTELRLQRSK